MNLSFLRDRSFLRELLVIAIPISFQQLINASLNMIDVIMVGQLGETAIAALGLSNQVFFVLILILFGLTSGMAIFTAQYWGKREIEPIRKVLGMSLIAAVFLRSSSPLWLCSFLKLCLAYTQQMPRSSNLEVVIFASLVFLIFPLP